MSLRDFGSQFTTNTAQSAGTTPTTTTATGAPPPTQPTTTTPATTTPDSTGSTGALANLNSAYGGGYTGFGNTVLTPQAAANGGGNGGGGSLTPPGINGAQPKGLYTNQASQLNPNYGPNAQGGAMSFINNFNRNHPLMNLTVDDFDRANQKNSEVALQMLSQGGQQFRNAVMSAHGWNQNQMNQWLNQVFNENQGGVANPNAGTAQTFAQFGSTQAQPTNYGPQGYAPGFTGPQVNSGPLGYTNYTQSPTYRGGPPVPNPSAPPPINPYTHTPAAPPPAPPRTDNYNINPYSGSFKPVTR